jgi:hypothetical protein
MMGPCKLLSDTCRAQRKRERAGGTLLKNFVSHRILPQGLVKSRDQLVVLEVTKKNIVRSED